MNAGEIVARCRESDIRLWVEDGRLRYDAPAGGMTPKLREMLRTHKAALMAWLTPAPTEAEVRADSMCGWEHHRRFWRRPALWGGGWVCAICHPAPPGAEVQTVEFGAEEQAGE